MNIINYMWSFKPNEKNKFPPNVIINNAKYIKQYRLVTPQIIMQYLKNDTFEDLEYIYNLIPNWVIKTDLSRLLIIYFNGGIYSDADCFITKNLNVHKDSDNIILFVEKICNSVSQLGKRECKNPENLLRISNYFFGSKMIGHPFLKEVIDECINRLKQLLIVEKKTTLNHEDILWVCGPDVITTVYHKSKQNYNDIYLYNNTYLNHKAYGSWR